MLEIGSGTGIVGIALAKAGAKVCLFRLCLFPEPIDRTVFSFMSSSLAGQKGKFEIDKVDKKNHLNFY